MTRQTMEDHLRQTLDDLKLSRGERRAVGAVLGDLDPSPGEVAVLRSMAFRLAREAPGESLRPADVLDWLEEVLKLLQPDVASRSTRSEAAFSPGESCRGRICSLFRHARQKADVCVFTITDNQITEEIVAAHQRGVQVRIVTDDCKSSDRGSDIDVLQRCGIDVRLDRSPYHMHHKFAVFDDQRLLTGSYNWTVSAMRDNQENLIVTDDADLVREFSEVFEQLWERFHRGG